MLKLRSSLLVSALVLAAAMAGCKRAPDEGLVLFQVMVPESVSFTSIDFSIDGFKSLSPRHVSLSEIPGNNKHAFRFGYYLPSVSATTLTIDATAYDGSCIVGTGTLPNVSVPMTGKIGMATNPLIIVAVAKTCPATDGGGGHGPGGQGGMAGSAGGSDAREDAAGGTDGDGAVDQTGTNDDASVVVTGKQANGKACGLDGDCVSGFCRDGVCCNEACSGQCKACAATFTGGVDGTCGNVMAGTSSRGACVDETVTKPCGHDGTCDGAGMCKTVAAGQPCGQSTCTDAHSFQGAGKCNGAGMCMTPVKTDCGAYPCAATGCAKPCTAATDCPDPLGQYCSNGTCKVKKALGNPCMAATECGSGFCSPDQVCCDKACTGACTACIKASTGQTDGTCGPVQLGQDPRNDCAADVAGSCGKDGNCDGKGGCHLTASGTSCGSATCSSSTFTPGKVCNGTGMCVAGGAAMDCGQNACTTGGCKTACATDGDCGASAYCDKTTSECTGKVGNGMPCSVGNECTSGACVEGVCCNTACGGTCLSCLSSKTGGANGTCAFIKAGMPDSRCTPADKSTCGQDGNCNGAGQCEKWSSATVCAAAMCSSGNYLAARMCSNGVCNPAAQTACGGAVCDPASGCHTTCTTGSDCTGNFYCDATTNPKKCAALKANGSPCGTDGTQCLTGLCVDGVCCNLQCNGQCQSCSTGTCANVTTARTACGGSGMCAGYCSGSSAGCTFPGNGSSCGSTGCMDGTTAYVAGSCNGGGTCIGATTNRCTYVCVNGGCGGGCHPGDLQCSNGVRQQCQSNGQWQDNKCSGTGEVCTGAGTCGCPSGQTSCSNVCVTTNTNTHCGGCNGCGTNMKCDPSTETCVDICSGGGTGTSTHCCNNRDCPASSPVCNNNTCLACTPGQAPTCSGTLLLTCSSNGTSLTMTNCSRGCAAGGCCSSPTEAAGATCMACGGEGQACCKIASPGCGTGLQCQKGTCALPCDGANQPCCEGSTQQCGGTLPGCNVTGVSTCHGGTYGTCSMVDAPTCCPQTHMCTKNVRLVCLSNGSGYDFTNFETCTAGMGQCYNPASEGLQGDPYCR